MGVVEACSLYASRTQDRVPTKAFTGLGTV